MTQALVLAAGGELAEFWLPHAVITSPHATAARTLTVAVRPRAAARVSPRQAADRALGSLTT
ncbi:MAG: hypothetical protein WBF34_29985 [Streptosporangiaceae bacterium]